MDRTQIERTILSTFLYANSLQYDTSQAFKLDPNVFTGVRKLIAAKINEVTDTEDRFYSLLELELEQTTTDEWMMITVQDSFIFPMAKKYHDHLINMSAHTLGSRI